MHIKLPLQTSMGSGLLHNDVNKDLLRALGSRDLDEMLHHEDEDNVKHISIVTKRYGVDDIVVFNHPIHIEFRGNPYIISDLRPFTRVAENDKGWEISNNKEFDFTVIKSILTAKWYAEDRTDMGAEGRLAGTVFAHMLANKISDHYGLHTGVKIDITIVAALYYSYLFKDSIDEYRDISKVQDVYKHLELPVRNIERVIGAVESPTSLATLVAAIKTASNTVKTTNLNIGTLLTMMNSIFYGFNSREVIAIALEYPPYWIAMVGSTINDKSYRNSYLSRLTNNLGKKGKSDVLGSYIERTLMSVNKRS